VRGEVLESQHYFNQRGHTTPLLSKYLHDFDVENSANSDSAAPYTDMADMGGEKGKGRRAGGGGGGGGDGGGSCCHCCSCQ
jgi:hypothetical protein